MTTLIIARHGNTFEADQTPTRVGARTDLPLVDSGREQAKKLGAWLKENNYHPDVIYCSQLKRTQETASIAAAHLVVKEPVFPLAIFNEIDYGVDENMPESDVIARIGQDALTAWDEQAVVPHGWNFDAPTCIKNWKNFANQCIGEEMACVVVVTSNGIARFAPHITGDFEGFKKTFPLKLSTGALGVLEFQNNQWIIKNWNIKP